MHFYGLTNNSKSTKSEKSGKTKEKVNVYHFFGWVHITGIATIQALYDYKKEEAKGALITLAFQFKHCTIISRLSDKKILLIISCLMRRI